MPATATDRLFGLTTSVAVKAPCRTVATSNIALAGLQTISTITVVEGDRVLVTAQSTGADNGIYLASSGTWTRAPDFDGARDAVQGTQIPIVRTGAQTALYEVATANPITIGSTAITFTLRYSANLQYDITAAESAAGVTPVNYAFLPGDVRRYGANTTPGTTNMTVAINNALAANTRVYLQAGVYFCSAALNLLSGQTLYGDGAASVLQFSNATISNIVGTGITNTTVRDLKINVTGTGSSASTGGVLFSACTYCKVERVEFVGMNWAGVWIKASQNCIVRGCHFHGFTSTNQDAADVCIYNSTGDAASASYNIVESNEMFGGCDYGLLCQAASGTLIPSNNIVRGNRVGQHAAYGLVFYNNAPTHDGFNTAEGNYIENIQGNPGHGPGTASGAGIYCASMGGMTIIGNTIRNCCVQSAQDTLTPAAIGLNNDTLQAPFTVSGNTIIDMPRYYAIKIIGGAHGGAISGNSIRITTPNATYPCYAIYLFNSSTAPIANLTVSGNDIYIANSVAGTVGIYVHAVGANITNLALNGNTILGTSSGAILVDQSGGVTTNYLSVGNNTFSGGGTAAVGLNLQSVVQGTVSGNSFNVSTTVALSITACTQLRLAANTFITSGTLAVSTASTCTGSYFDKSNFANTGLQNAATGMICEQLANATPGNNSAVGDRIEQSVPVVGSPKGWRCTVAGNPGTWVSEGNL
jgi:hypothetical protein